MNIGEFCDTFPPMLDGVGRVAMSYCSELAKMGHSAYYIAPDAPKYKEQTDVSLVAYKSVPIPGLPYRVGLPATDFSFRRGLDALSIDIAHAHSPFFTGMEALRQKRKLGIPLVATLHSKYFDDILKATHSKAIAKKGVSKIVGFFDKCDEVWTVNDSTAEVLEGYGYKGEIIVMENGTDGAELSSADRKEAEERFSIKSGEHLLLYVGQHDYKKNIKRILLAMKLLKGSGYPFRLVMVGKGGDEKKIREDVSELGLENNVTLAGFEDRRNILLALYERAELLVFPSLYDTCGLVVREAAVMGTPSIVVRSSCAAEGIEDGVNGFLCTDDESDIARIIPLALERSEAVGRAAAATLPIAWSQIVAKAEKRYMALIEKSKG
ncbi:MAG: glycosyltransferase [Eubacteriales bacterium]|nr:glycosyltransferase [Eubacteriales bacterium]MDD3882833.1 glycosyltransferase [Eubacteriales bacterium]MDD4513269.1 glycosyltransferase [Eubacteriales bacterium]